VNLCADWCDEHADTICLTLCRRSSSNNATELHHRSWLDRRGRWLRRLGKVFGDRFRDTLEPRHWMLLSPLWAPLEYTLPWNWPGQVAACDTRSPWPLGQRRAWFFTLLAQVASVTHGLYMAFGPAGEFRARLKFQELNYRLGAIHAARQAMGRPGDGFEPAGWRSAFEALRDRFEEIDEQYDGIAWCSITDAQQITPVDERSLDTSNLLDALESAFWKELQAFTREAHEWFPLRPGLWLRDGRMLPGLVLDQRVQQWRREEPGEDYSSTAQGALASRYEFFIVDWGVFGITRETVLVGARPPQDWRWPVVPLDDFTPGEDEVYVRWKAFALNSITANCLAICPCCGYPHLEGEPEEIHDCPLCGWDLIGESSAEQVDPDTTISLGDDMKLDLAQARRNFAHHGDAYAADDTDNTSWLRRQDVQTLRERVRAALHAWLQALEPKPPLPEEDWETLDRMSRH